MELLSTLALSIGPVLAKSIVKEWLKGKGPIPDLAERVIELADGKLTRALSRRDANRRIEEIGKRTVENLQPLFDSEARDFDKGTRNAIALELANTLAQTEITANLLISCNLEPQRLARHLTHACPGAVATLSSDERFFYERMLSEASREIVGIAGDLSGFQASAFAATLEGQDQILAMLLELRAQPHNEAAAFEQRYREAVERQLDHMELFGLPRMDSLTRRQSLTLAYVALQAETSAQDAAATAGDDSRHRLASRSGQARSATQPAVPIDQLLAMSRRFVLRGEAGSGKSTLVQWLSVRAAKRDFPSSLAAWNNTIPFFLRLRELVGKGFPPPEDFPRMVAPIVAGAMPQRDWVHRQLYLGRALVLVDGLDEIPGEQRQDMLTQLAAHVREFPLARYVVTSRPAALRADRWPEWEHWRIEEGFTEATLQPMDVPQIERFIEQWHTALSETAAVLETPEDLAVVSGNLKRLLRQRPALRRLATSPLLCAMVCALHHERHQYLPSERLTLYKECCEMLLGRDRGRKIARDADYPDLSESQKFSLLQSFAYWLMRNGHSDTKTGHADSHFASRIVAMSLAAATGEGVRRYFVERSSLLREPVQGRIDFTHRTFQEYLAALQAVKEEDFGFLTAHALDDQWRETIVLAAGLARPKESEQLIRELISKRRWGRKGLERSRILALACLETASELPQEVRRLAVRYASAIFPPKDFEEAKLVAAAGDLAVPLLAQSPEHSLAQEEKSLEALMLIGSDIAMTQIAEYAKRRGSALQVGICRAWEAFNRKEYAVRVLRHVQELWLDDLNSWEGFESLSHVTRLTVVQVAVDDLSALAHLRELRELSFGLKPGSAQDHQALLESLPVLENLVSLTIASFSARDVGFLRRHTKLEFLSLRSTGQGFDPSPIGNITSLKSLNLSRNAVDDISFITVLHDLVSVDLSRTNVRDLSPLQELPNLTDLEIVETLAGDLQVLVKVSKLKTLTIDPSRVDELARGDLAHLQIKVAAN